MFKYAALRLLATLFKSNADLPSSYDEGAAPPDLTMLFIILACVLVAGLTVYVIVRVWMHVKHEQAVLNRGLRAGIPNIKALNNDLPANSLNTLHAEDKGEKSDKNSKKD